MIACTDCRYAKWQGTHRYCTIMHTHIPNLGCDEGEPFPPTNADIIREMSDYDLADWIAKVLTYHGNLYARRDKYECDKDCPLYYCCNDQPTDNIEGWLKSPVKDGES